MTWCDRIAWDHSAALGLPIERCLELDRGMAVVRTVIQYLRPALLGDVVHVATWIVPVESRLRVRRRFQIKRLADESTLARAEIEYVCIELSSGRPMRWPPEFRERYVSIPEVAGGDRDAAAALIASVLSNLPRRAAATAYACADR